MALEIIVRRRRTAKRLPETDSRETPEPPDSVGEDEPEATEKADPPVNDNEGAWPLIPFPDGW